MSSTPAPYVVTPLLEKLLARHDLAQTEAREIMTVIMQGRLTGPSLAAFLTALRAKGEHETEIAAFAAVLREHAVRIHSPPGTLDTCGTGGDKSATFNISTCTAFVAAGMGIPVAKHGNRSVSSRSGSSEVLKTLRVNLDASLHVLERCLNEARICFLFAPLHHPGMKHAALVRKELGIHTVFNLLGPLANPAGAQCQLLGVFEPRLCEVFAHVLRDLGSIRAMVVCGSGPGGRGYCDEISIFGPTTLVRLEGAAIHKETFDAESVGIPRADAAALSADSPEASAQIIREVLDGKLGPARDIVLLNAAAAAQVCGLEANWPTGLASAAESIDSGKARRALEALVTLSNTP